MVEAKSGGGPSLAPQQTHLIKPKTRKGKRYLEKRGPKLVSFPHWRPLFTDLQVYHVVLLLLPLLRDVGCCLQIEDAKRALFLYGNDASQMVKDAMTDIHKLKGVSTKPL